MAGTPPRTKMLDKLKQKMGLKRSLSREVSLFPRKGDSNLALASSDHSKLAPSSSATPKAEDLNAENTSSTVFNAGVSTATDLCTSSSTEKPGDMSSEQAAAAPPCSTTKMGNIVPLASTTPDAASHTGNSKSTQPQSASISPPDLWDAALQKLSIDDQEAIQKLQPNSSTQQPMSEKIDELRVLTSIVQDKCKAKAYKFRFRGKDIIVRDIAGKIIFWLNKFKEVGDIAVNFDPVHASLPWAGVRFLLQVCQSYHTETMLNYCTGSDWGARTDGTSSHCH
jgi:hypothetical protein